MPTAPPPPWGRSSHSISTPRLILRSAKVSDAHAFTVVRRSPANSPHGGVVNAGRSEEQQAIALGKQAASTAEGKNAWMVVILKVGVDTIVDEEEKKWRDELRVEDGFLIGMTGFNSFPRETLPRESGGEEQEVLLGDLGVLIDSHFQHKGYATETLQALFEYGFYELNIDAMFLETDTDNSPFRELMKSLVGDVESEGEGGKSVIFRCTRQKWSVEKGVLSGRGRWYLSLS